MRSRLIQKVLFYLLVSVLLLFVYPLDLYFPTGNQCIYFFWGIKNSGFGFLEHDFLATQADPFPLFSLLVQYSYSFFGVNSFFLWYWMLNLVYVIAFFEIVDVVRVQIPSLSGRVREGCLFLFAHSTLIWGFFFSRFFNLDLRWAWDSGFAEQGILRGYFQPSVFGVFILLSVALFAKMRFLLAFVSAAAAACFHANYLLVSAVFISVYLLFSVREKNYKTAIIGSVISFAIVLPYLLYVFKNFGTTSSETVEYIRNNIEGHIHFDYKVWINAEAFLQMSLIVFALWLVRKTDLLFPLLIGLAVLVVLTLITYASGSIFLLNLTPWRISVVLVPVAVAVVVAHLSSITNSKFSNLIISVVFTTTVSALYFRIFGNNSADFILKWRILTLIIFIVTFVVVLLFEKYRSNLNFEIIIPIAAQILIVCLGLSGILLHKSDTVSKQELVAFVRNNSSDKQHYLISPEFTDFRLATGVAVFVDSTIYHSNALPEWDKRVKISNRFFKSGDAVLLDSLDRNCGITHIIAKEDFGFNKSNEVYRNKRYAIFEVSEQ
ncbi:MAG: hypothetical protein POELPBGB_00102 [Bacteroidia bacterium]|nr:hypothetical protein [Bacteroidia bacterium]